MGAGESEARGILPNSASKSDSGTVGSSLIWGLRQYLGNCDVGFVELQKQRFQKVVPEAYVADSFDQATPWRSATTRYMA